MNPPLHVVCPHCDTTNRVPARRLESKPMCGDCRRYLFVGEPAPLGGISVQKHLRRSDIPVLVNFWVPGVNGSGQLLNQLTNAAGKLEPWMRLATVNIGSELGVGALYGIHSVPTLALFENGREVTRRSGPMVGSEIVSWVQNRSNRDHGWVIVSTERPRTPAKRAPLPNPPPAGS